MEQLENYILAETRKILNEELGVSKEVQEATSNVLEFVNEILSHKDLSSIFNPSLPNKYLCQTIINKK